MPIRFKLATLTDIEALVDLENRAFKSDKLSARQMKILLLKPNMKIIKIATTKQLLAAAILQFKKNSKIVRVTSFAVNPTVRKKGYGDALLNYIESYLGHKYHTIKLEVRLDNLPAIRLYQKHGYKEVGEIIDFYEDGCTAKQFCKVLSNHMKLK